MAQEVPHRSQWSDRHPSPRPLPYTSKGIRAQAVPTVEGDPRGLSGTIRSADDSGVPRQPVAKEFQIRASASQRTLEGAVTLARSDSKDRIRGTVAGPPVDGKERQRRVPIKNPSPQAARKKSGSPAPAARRPIRHTSALWVHNVDKPSAAEPLVDKPSAAEPLGEDQQNLVSSVHALLQKVCTSFEERLKNLELRTAGLDCTDEASSVVPKFNGVPENDMDLLERQITKIHNFSETRYGGMLEGRSREISQSSLYEARFKAIEAVIEENMAALDIIPWLQSRVCAMDKLLQEVPVQAGSTTLNMKGLRRGAADLAEPELTGQAHGESPAGVEQATGSHDRLSDTVGHCQVLEPRFDQVLSRISSLEVKEVKLETRAQSLDSNLESLWANNDAVASWIEKFDVEMSGVQKFVTVQISNLHDYVGRVVGSSPFSVTIQSVSGFRTAHPHLCCSCEVLGKAGSEEFETQAACGTIEAASRTFEAVWNESYELLDFGLDECLQFRILDKHTGVFGPVSRSLVLGEATLSGKDIFTDGFQGVLKLLSGSSSELELHLTIVRLGLSSQHAKLRELEASCNDVWKVIPNIKGVPSS